jgi:hypothetical protein
MFNHMKRARFGDERSVKTWIFASEIELAKDGSGGNMLLVDGGRIFSGESEGKGKKEGGDG